MNNNSNNNRFSDSAVALSLNPVLVKEYCDLLKERAVMIEEHRKKSRELFSKKDTFVRREIVKIMSKQIPGGDTDPLLQGLRCILGKDGKTVQYFAKDKETGLHVMVFPQYDIVLLNGYMILSSNDDFYKYLSRVKLYFERYHLLRVHGAVWKCVDSILKINGGGFE